MELKHESITLSSLVRRALNQTYSIVICFSREGGGVLAPGVLRSLYRRVQGILRSLLCQFHGEEGVGIVVDYTLRISREARSLGYSPIEQLE